jgi:triacylglycerol lipase
MNRTMSVRHLIWILLTTVYSFCFALPAERGGQSTLNLHPFLHPFESIDSMVYDNLFTYAHLIDISYCITEVSGIQKPFRCNLDCDDFPDFNLVKQWCTLNNNCGYIATTHSNVFHYSDTSDKTTIIVAFRGTNSMKDSYADMRVDSITYTSSGKFLPECTNCQVHKGFYDYYHEALNKIGSTILQELDLADDDYELVILGHSLGGNIALLLGLHFLGLGYDKLSVVTMGQPKLGNKHFVNWVDQVMGSANKVVHNSFERKYIRVVHKNDIVTTIPDVHGKYHQFNNQIYLNTSSKNTFPLQDEVLDCGSTNNPGCISGDFTNLSFWEYFTRNYLEIHLHYFRKIGFCNYHLFSTNP